MQRTSTLLGNIRRPGVVQTNYPGPGRDDHQHFRRELVPEDRGAAPAPSDRFGTNHRRCGVRDPQTRPGYRVWTDSVLVGHVLCAAVACHHVCQTWLVAVDRVNCSELVGG